MAENMLAYHQGPHTVCLCFLIENNLASLFIKKEKSLFLEMLVQGLPGYFRFGVICVLMMIYKSA